MLGSCGGEGGMGVGMTRGTAGDIEGGGGPGVTGSCAGQGRRNICTCGTPTPVFHTQVPKLHTFNPAKFGKNISWVLQKISSLVST